LNKGERQTAWLLFAMNLIIHLPFLFMGYGKEEDAWSNVLNARLISSTGVYEVSRLPGHPLYEGLLSFLYPYLHDAWFFNGLSALASAFAVYFFYKILLSIKIPHAFWLTLCLTFIPVFFIAGTYTIDYNFALLFILLSFYLLIKKQWVFAGIFLGLAVGFRISSLGFLLPWLIWCINQKTAPAQIGKLVLSSLMISALVFKLPFDVYGLSFLDFHKPPFPSLSNILYKLSLGIWGLPLSLFLVYILIRQIGQWKNVFKEHRKLLIIALLAVLMQLAVFLRLPFKSEFFIPALPFCLIVLGFLISRKQAMTLSLFAFFSVFLFGFDYASKSRGARPSPLALKFKASGQTVFLDPVKGPAFIDQSKRKHKSDYVDRVIEWSAQEEYPFHIISGWFWAELAVKLPEQEIQDFDYFSTEQELIEASALGKNIYYLPEINQSNSEVYQHYLADSLGQVLRPL
jgi:Gpi18-like mannosyltransferase